MRNISLFRYFLPVILAAFLVTSVNTAKAELVVGDSGYVDVTTSFYGSKESWKDYFAPEQWNVLKDEVGQLHLDGKSSFLVFTSQFDFMGVDDEGASHRLSVQFSAISSGRFYVSKFGGKAYTEYDDSSYSYFALVFGEDGILSSLVFTFVVPEDSEELYEVDFEATAKLQAGGGTEAPEPATLLIFAMGLVGAGLAARRKRK